MTAVTNHNSHSNPARRRGGAILLEVVLAVTLFVVMAAVILGAVGRATDAAARMRLRARAGDLAVTLVSELQMGLIEIVDAGPRHYSSERLADWTWQVDVESLDDPLGARRIEATVIHEPTGLNRRLVYVTADGEEGA